MGSPRSIHPVRQDMASLDDEIVDAPVATEHATTPHRRLLARMADPGVS
jgi:hypothetical protein